jgi:hypothetical protein
VRISLAPLKGSIEDQLGRLQDALLVALRRAVLDEFKEVHHARAPQPWFLLYE